MTAGWKLSDLATALGGRVSGDGSLVVQGVAPLESAGPADLTFLTHPRYRTAALETKAAAVLVGEPGDLPGVCLIVVRDPYLALARVVSLFHPAEPAVPGVGSGAVIDPSSDISPEAEIGPMAVVGPRCRIGAGARVMAGAVLGPGVRVGRDSVIHPNVTVEKDCVIGERAIVHAGTVIGSDGFGFARDGEAHVKIPQTGNVIIEDDVEIGANVTIDRATFGSTVIGRGSKIDNLVQIAHNVTVGEHCLLVAQVGISGSTRIGRRTVFAGQSGAVGHISVGDGVTVGAKSAVTRDVPDGAFVIGHPAIEASVWKRAMAVFAKLPDLRRRLGRLEGSHRGGRGQDDEDTNGEG